MTTTTKRKRAPKSSAPKAAPKTADTTPVQATVALPTWGNADIIWLQLESLLRQETTAKWELIISECESSNLALKVITDYSQKLLSKGVSVTYLRNASRMPLLEKWVQMATQAKGEVFIMVATDCYSPSTLVQNAVDRHAEGYNWTQDDHGLFFDFLTGRKAVYRSPEGASGLNFSARTASIASLPIVPLERGIDGYMMRTIRPSKVYRNTNLTMGVHTDGYNTISKKRMMKYAGQMLKPFYRTSVELTDVVPSDVAERITEQSSGLLSTVAEKHGLTPEQYLERL